MNSLMADFDLPDAMRLHPTRRPVVDGAEFRAALSTMASTVTVVTARRGEERIGRTVTSMLSLSNNPPTILISIAIMSRLTDLIAKTGGFSLAMLAQDQNEIADAFAGRVEAAARFNTGRWSEWNSGHPKLLGAVTGLDCEVVGSVETGTHVLFAGAIIDTEVADELSPLIWQKQRYRELGDD